MLRIYTVGRALCSDLWIGLEWVCNREGRVRLGGCYKKGLVGQGASKGKGSVDRPGGLWEVGSLGITDKDGGGALH